MRAVRWDARWVDTTAVWTVELKDSRWVARLAALTDCHSAAHSAMTMADTRVVRKAELWVSSTAGSTALRWAENSVSQMADNSAALWETNWAGRMDALTAGQTVELLDKCWADKKADSRVAHWALNLVVNLVSSRVVKLGGSMVEWKAGDWVVR